MVDGPLTQEEYLAVMAGGPPLNVAPPAQGLSGVLQRFGQQVQDAYQQPMMDQTMAAADNAGQVVDAAGMYANAVAAPLLDPIGYSEANPNTGFNALFPNLRQGLANYRDLQGQSYNEKGGGTNITLGRAVDAAQNIWMGEGAADRINAENAAIRAAAPILAQVSTPAPRPTPADIAQQQEDTLKRATGNEEAYASIMDRVAAGPDAGPLVYRANNPGGINAVKWVQNMPGYIGSYEGTPGNATAVFETPSQGAAVLAHRVAQNAGDGLSSYIASYGGGGQDYLTSGYYDSFLSASGLSPDATIDIADDEQLFAILKGHTVAEGGAGRFSDEDLLAGIAMFREGQEAEPAGDNDANAIVAATADNPPVMQLDYSTAKSASDILDDLGLSKTPINAAEAFRRIQNTDYAGDFDAKEAALDSLFNAGIAMMRAASRPGASTLESLSYGMEALGAGIEGRRQQAEAAGEARRNQDVELLKMQIADEQAAFDRRLAVVKQLNDAAAEARQATMDNATLQKTLAQTDAIRQGMVGSGGFGPSLQDRRLVLDSAAKYASERAPAPPVGLLETEEEAEARQQAWEFYYNEFLQRLGMDPANTLFFGDSVL